jgi:putative flippase GtrA
MPRCMPLSTTVERCVRRVVTLGAWTSRSGLPSRPSGAASAVRRCSTLSIFNDVAAGPTRSRAACVPTVRRTLPRFAAIGILSVAVDVSLLVLLHSVVGVELVASTSVSFAASLVVNYSLNHVWVFDVAGVSWQRFFRYGVLVLINFALTLALVTGLTSLGLYYLVAKALAVAVGAVINFTGYRFWVFR